MTTVLYFQASGKASARQKLEGAYAFARAQGWNMQALESGMTPRKAAELARFWQPDGIIVECGSEQNHFDPAIFGNVPVVFLDRNPQTLAKPVFCVVHDSAATARVAARELLSLRLVAYAYIPWSAPRFWSDARETGFADALRLNGKGYSRFAFRGKADDALALQAQLGDWLANLPKPVGVFAANDQMAVHFLAAATRCGVNVPRDAAVVGVDNNELLCENTQPTLSSVMADFAAAGHKAAEMLALRIANPRLRPRTETFGPLRLVRRASTMRLEKADPEVLVAQDLIRRRACEGLRARDVFALFPCSRRMAEIRFRAATGRSVLSEIQSVRQTRAEDLIRNSGLDRTAIANFCGYSSASALGNFLRRQRTSV